jgi:hypothetical protein
MPSRGKGISLNPISFVYFVHRLRVLCGPQARQGADMSITSNPTNDGGLTSPTPHQATSRCREVYAFRRRPGQRSSGSISSTIASTVRAPADGAIGSPRTQPSGRGCLDDCMPRMMIKSNRARSMSGLLLLL